MNLYLYNLNHQVLLRDKSVWRFLIIIAALSLMPAAEARLGQSFAQYKAQHLKNYKAAGEKKGKSGKHYLFQLSLSDKEKRMVPGFGEGLTITVLNGKITGQSLVINMGRNKLIGTDLAIAHGLAFVYESLGKPAPKSRFQASRDVQAFTGVVHAAMGGYPQTLRYPGYKGKATVKKDSNGNVIIAVTP